MKEYIEKYIMYCKGCQIVRIDDSNLECKQCLNKMEDMGWLQYEPHELIRFVQKNPNIKTVAWLKEHPNVPPEYYEEKRKREKAIDSWALESSNRNIETDGLPW